MSTELTKIEYLRSKITSLADHIRAKAGKSDAMTFAELEAAVDGISTGGSGGGGSTGGGSSDSGSGTSTIENGYTVNFHNTDKVLIESHSAKFGMWIDAPISYTPNSWINENGYRNQFPLTVEEGSETTVFNLYPSTDTVADVIYAHCGVDVNTYPYLWVMCMWYNNSYLYIEIAFCQEGKMDSRYMYDSHFCEASCTEGEVMENWGDVSYLLKLIRKYVDPNNFYTRDKDFFLADNRHNYTNYDTDIFTNWYDLRV